MCSINAGVTSSWPSPAQDYYQGPISLDARYLGRPSRYLLRSEAQLACAGIAAGDVLIVDRAVDPGPGMILVVVADGEHRIARLTPHGTLAVDAGVLTATDAVRFWGVVTALVRDLLIP
ncbi:Protein UmuD [Austwickia sp. TVS 96-490-7B]|uniref:LexA family protein n=1 Tax=Austwickia sp. TVS 96-490-7B TaxID=2830843 RepID=UPI001C570683|nr:DNA polymerase subunit UmuD [Austwickia sp. TVS 96-490-7B]MBW3086194.1 Protein UmuD [Austwickia sp. TVS 96-490-7B]